jgi:hypothetical protein
VTIAILPLVVNVPPLTIVTTCVSS